MGLLEIMIVVFVLGPLAGAVAHRIQKGAGEAETDGGDDGGPVASREEVRRLQRDVERLTDEVQRLVQQQDFLERLLERRPADRTEDGERNTAP